MKKTLYVIMQAFNEYGGLRWSPVGVVDDEDKAMRLTTDRPGSEKMYYREIELNADLLATSRNLPKERAMSV